MPTRATPATGLSPTSATPGVAPSNSSWHGTHVAGTIGAATNNASNIAGINWVSKILPVRVLGKCGGYTSDIMDAMTWAAGLSVPGVPSNPNPAKVINLSLGGGGACDPVFEQPIINNVIAAGTTVVIAAGNSNGDAANFSPGNCNGVITVAATQRAGARASYSNWGTTVEIAAPGGGDGNYILSTLNSGATVPAAYVLALYQGTSMATPHVAGIVSLMLSANPALTPAQVLSKVQSTARAFPTGTGRDCTANPAAVNATVKYCGAGIIDAQAAVLSAGGGGGGPVATTTAVASSLNPAGLGASVTFTATVTGKAPTGTVNFRDAGVTFGGCGAVAFTGGAGDVRTAQCTTSSLAAGAHSITAVYSGDAGNLTSTSPVLTQSIGLSTSSTALTASPNPAAPGVLVTFTATVTGNAPIGTVNFKDGGVTFGGCGAVAFTGGAGNVRTAKCTTSSLPVGTHMIVATFSGDAGNAGSSSPTLYQFIFGSGPTASSTGLQSSLNPAPAGQSVTFTATVSGKAPTGTVNFKDGGVTFGGCGAVAFTGGAGDVRTAQCTTSALAAGTHSLVATYSGDAGNQTSSSPSVVAGHQQRPGGHDDRAAKLAQPGAGGTVGDVHGDRQGNCADGHRQLQGRRRDVRGLRRGRVYRRRRRRPDGAVHDERPGRRHAQPHRRLQRRRRQPDVDQPDVVAGHQQRPGGHDDRAAKLAQPGAGGTVGDVHGDRHGNFADGHRQLHGRRRDVRGLRRGRVYRRRRQRPDGAVHDERPGGRHAQPDGGVQR